jgi:hypothetical protein
MRSCSMECPRDRARDALGSSIGAAHIVSSTESGLYVIVVASSIAPEFSAHRQGG